MSIGVMGPPIEVAEFDITMDIAYYPALAWWVPYTVKKRDIIISAVNARFLKRQPCRLIPIVLPIVLRTYCT